MDQRFNKADKRVHKLMTEAYEKRLPCSAEMRHKALVWSCPANYYTNFSNWLEQCWGIVSVMDMETHISQVIIDTSTPETMLEGVALTYTGTWYVTRYNDFQNKYWYPAEYEITLLLDNGRANVKALSLHENGFSLMNAEGGGGYERATGGVYSGASSES